MGFSFVQDGTSDLFELAPFPNPPISHVFEGRGATPLTVFVYVDGDNLSIAQHGGATPARRGLAPVNEARIVVLGIAVLKQLRPARILSIEAHRVLPLRCASPNYMEVGTDIIVVGQNTDRFACVNVTLGERSCGPGQNPLGDLKYVKVPRITSFGIPEVVVASSDVGRNFPGGSVTHAGHFPRRGGGIEECGDGIISFLAHPNETVPRG